MCMMMFYRSFSLIFIIIEPLLLIVQKASEVLDLKYGTFTTPSKFGQKFGSLLNFS